MARLQPWRELSGKRKKENESEIAFFGFLSLSFTFRNPDFSKGCERKK